MATTETGPTGEATNYSRDVYFGEHRAGSRIRRKLGSAALLNPLSLDPDEPYEIDDDKDIYEGIVRSVN